LFYNLDCIMPPKFESSFIPKGPLVSGAGMPLTHGKGEHTLLGFIAGLLFAISALSAIGVFGYKFYLNYAIDNMKEELEAGRVALETETLSEITRLNNRLLATEALVDSHLALSPLFKFIDVSTLRTVRFNDFSFTTNEKGLAVTIEGEAKSYASLALQADLLNKSPYFKEPVFSDLRLDDRGNVAFTFEALVDGGKLSYRKEVEKLGAKVAPVVATSTATTTRSTATTTPR